MTEFKGLIPTIMDMQPCVVEYNTNHSVEELCKLVIDYDNQVREERKNNGWKPEYILSRYQAEEWPLEWLNWLGENYKVLCGLEVYEIVKRREDENKK